MLKLAYIDLQEYLTTLEDKHKDLSKQLHDVETSLQENQILRKIKQSIRKLNNNTIATNVRLAKLKMKLQKKVKY